MEEVEIRFGGWLAVVVSVVVYGPCEVADVCMFSNGVVAVRGAALYYAFGKEVGLFISL